MVAVVLALSEEAQRAADFGIAAAAALAVWLVLLAVLAAATRADLPDAEPATPDFGGPETPAVVNFLVNRWDVGHEAVPATLLDLAARGAVSIEQVAPERFVCRLRRGVDEDLTDYERQVLDHVRRLAHDGVVPCEALTTGPEADSKGWWSRFQKSVVADARSQGLSRGRWGKGPLGVLSVLAIVPAALAATALVLAPDDTPRAGNDDEDEEESPIGAFLGLTAVGWGALMAIPASLRAERHTAKGKDVAARWLGLYEWLDEDEAFDRAPPAVAIWDRYLAYGAAMGVAAGAVRALPLGSESDTEAWSSYGGHWHVVRVRYPNRIPPGWGQRPLVATAKGLATCAFAFFLATRIAPPVADVVGDVLDTARDEGWETWALIGTAVGGAFLAAIALFVLRSAVMLVLAVPDLFAKVQVEGRVIRLRNNYLAVDDGEHRRVRAWRVEPAKLAGVTRNDVVRVTASPNLGHVFQIGQIGTAPAATEATEATEATGAVATAPADAAAAAAMAETLTAAVAARTGVQLEVPDYGATAMPGADKAVVLTDGQGASVLAVVAAPNPVLDWVARRGAVPVDGVAGSDETAWNERRNILTAARGEKRVTVMVGLPAIPPPQRLDVAKVLAEHLL